MQNFSSTFPGLEALLLLDPSGSSPENQNLHLFVGLLHYPSKLHEFQWRFHCCCHYAVTLKLLKVSLQKLRINWAYRMTVCAPGKWIISFFTIECSIPQAKLSVDINVLIFTPINCRYLGGISSSSYLLGPIVSYVGIWLLAFQKPASTSEQKNILTELELLVQPPFVTWVQSLQKLCPKIVSVLIPHEC